MKRIVTLAALLSSTCISGFCQQKEPEYEAYKTEYATDSTGKSVPVGNPEYYRIRAKDGSSWGFKKKTGEFAIPLGKYKFMNTIDNRGMILAHKKGGKKGYIDITEKVLIPFVYDEIGVFSKCQAKDLAPVIIDKKQGFINRKGEVIIPLEYDAQSRVAYFYEPGVAILTKNGRAGAIGPENNIIVPFEYDEVKRSDNRDCLIARKGDSWIIFSTEGKQLSDYSNHTIVEAPFGSLPADSKGLPMLIAENGYEKIRNRLQSNIEYMNGSRRVKDSLKMLAKLKYAYIDSTARAIVPFGVYDYAEPFGLGRKAIVVKDGKYGLIDEYGKTVLPNSYDYLERPMKYSHFADIYVATRGNEITLFDKDANVFPIKGITSYSNIDGLLIAADTQNKTGVINYQGKQTIPFLYDTLYSCKYGGFIAKKDALYGYISPKNEIIHSFDYRYIYRLKAGMAYINSEGKVGLYDHKNRLIIPFEYDMIYDSYYGQKGKDRYIVQKEGKVGTVDSDNEVVIPILYDGLSGWVEYGPKGHFVKKDGKYGLISPEGKTIVPIEYDYVGLPVKGVIVVRKAGKYGAISWNNRVILPCIYDKLIDDISFWSFDFGEKHEDKLVALKDGIWSYFDPTGKLIRTNVPKEEIQKYYQYIFDWGEPSNESPDFNMIQAGGLVWEDMQ